MRKIFGLFFVLILSSMTANAIETALDDVDTTDYSHTTQNLKYFSEKEYEKAIRDYKNKFQKPKAIRKKDIKTPTTPFEEADENPEYKVLESIVNHKGSIMIPAFCKTDNGQQIYPGHYSLEYYEDKNGVEWLILSQGAKKVAKIQSQKSQSSADESTINYAYAIGKGDVIRLLYGNIDVAVEAKLYVIN